MVCIIDVHNFYAVDFMPRLRRQPNIKSNKNWRDAYARLHAIIYECALSSIGYKGGSWEMYSNSADLIGHVICCAKGSESPMDVNNIIEMIPEENNDMTLTNIQPDTQRDDLHMMGDRIFPDDRLLRALHNSRLVDNLCDADIKALTKLLTVQCIEVKELDSELNDDSLKDALMILVEGEIEVNAIVGNEPLTLHLAAPGDIARIVSFVGGNMMNISARIAVKRDSAVLLLQRSKLETLLHSHPALVYGVMRNLVLHVHGVARRKNAEKEEMSNYFYQMRGRY